MGVGLETPNRKLATTSESVVVKILEPFFARAGGGGGGLPAAEGANFTGYFVTMSDSNLFVHFPLFSPPNIFTSDTETTV